MQKKDDIKRQLQGRKTLQCLSHLHLTLPKRYSCYFYSFNLGEHVTPHFGQQKSYFTVSGSRVHAQKLYLKKRGHPLNQNSNKNCYSCIHNNRSVITTLHTVFINTSFPCTSTKKYSPHLRHPRCSGQLHARPTAEQCLAGFHELLTQRPHPQPSPMRRDQDMPTKFFALW